MLRMVVRNNPMSSTYPSMSFTCDVENRISSPGANGAVA